MCAVARPAGIHLRTLCFTGENAAVQEARYVENAAGKGRFGQTARQRALYRGAR
jgi:hypothetical protein